MDFLNGLEDMPPADQSFGDQITDQSQPSSTVASGTSFAPPETNFTAAQYLPPTMTPNTGTAVVTSQQSPSVQHIPIERNQQSPVTQPTINIIIPPTAATGPSHANLSSTLPQMSLFQCP